MPPTLVYNQYESGPSKWITANSVTSCSDGLVSTSRITTDNLSRPAQPPCRDGPPPASRLPPRSDRTGGRFTGAKGRSSKNRQSRGRSAAVVRSVLLRYPVRVRYIGHGRPPLGRGGRAVPVAALR